MKVDTTTLRIGHDELVMYSDQPDADVIGTALIISPAGMSAARMLPASYILSENGFRVVRFDPRHHPGRSTGTLRNFRLSSLVEDIEKVLEVAAADVLIAVSLSARAAIRTLVGRDQLKGSVMITPVVNVRHTLSQVLHRDCFAESDRDPTELVPVFGSGVEMGFIDDCIAAGMVDIRDAVADVAAINTPIRCIAGDADPWVSMDDIRTTASAAWHRGHDFRIVTVEAATHQLYRSPALAMTYFTEAAKESLRLVRPDSTLDRVPTFAEIIAVVESVTVEDDRARARSRSEGSPVLRPA
jgi:pimeloyl-ACP methyl ester carboxylesterase